LSNSLIVKTIEVMVAREAARRRAREPLHAPPCGRIRQTQPVALTGQNAISYADASMLTVRLHAHHHFHHGPGMGGSGVI
jgi:hypothetical protein